MSEYGKLWEQARMVREEIKRLVPTANTNDIQSAKESLASFKCLLDILVDRWETIESEMRDEHDV